MDTLLIYAQKKTNRLNYTFKLVFADLLKFPYRITTNLEEFQSSDLPKIVYADEPVSDDLFFQSNGFLLRRGVESLNFEPFAYGESKAFFPIENENAVLPFDVFAAIFFLVSRYEEYQPYVSDEHGRFTADLSISKELGILNKPLVNIWVLEIKSVLQKKYPEMKFIERKYKFVPTYDIDQAFAYAQKGLVRTLGGYLLDLVEFNWKAIGQRTKVVFGFEKDPFNTFDLQIEYQKKYNLRPFYFILFGRYGQYDKNINFRNKHFGNLVKRLGDYAQIGIHPSYGTFEYPERLSSEIANLGKVLNKEVTRSRQHFLRLLLPDTYRILIENDITDDYSMGYAMMPGFRAGICSSYNFYDLDIEEETKLRIHPFAVMDGTLRDYMKLTPADAIEQLRQLIYEVKKVNGTFISLWHNEPLSNEKRWEGWRRVYEEMLKMAVE